MQESFQKVLLMSACHTNISSAENSNDKPGDVDKSCKDQFYTITRTSQVISHIQAKIGSTKKIKTSPVI